MVTPLNCNKTELCPDKSLSLCAGVKLQVHLPADKPVICINLLPMFY